MISRRVDEAGLQDRRPGAIGRHWVRWNENREPWAVRGYRKFTLRHQGNDDVGNCRLLTFAPIPCGLLVNCFGEELGRSISMVPVRIYDVISTYTFDASDSRFVAE